MALHFVFPLRCGPNAGHSLLVLDASRSHITTQHNWYNSSGRVIISSQGPLPDTTHENIQDSDGIRTHNLSSRAATGLRLRPRGYWDRQIYTYVTINFNR